MELKELYSWAIRELFHFDKASLWASFSNENGYMFVGRAFGTIYTEYQKALRFVS